MEWGYKFYFEDDKCVIGSKKTNVSNYSSKGRRKNVLSKILKAS